MSAHDALIWAAFIVGAVLLTVFAVATFVGLALGIRDAFNDRDANPDDPDDDDA